MQKFRVNHGVVSETVVEGEAKLLALIADMVAGGISNILISRAESVVTVEQDDSDISVDTLTVLNFGVRVARRPEVTGNGPVAVARWRAGGPRVIPRWRGR